MSEKKTETIQEVLNIKKDAQEKNDTAFSKTFTFCGKQMTIESGKMARQADGSVVITCGETVVLTTVIYDKKDNDQQQSFLPLSVNYREMMYACGKIPAGFIKRESKPTDSEILTSRIIDRSVRSLFPKNFYKEVQIISSVLSYDGKTDPSVLSVLGASSALSISGLPISKTIAGVRIGYDVQTGKSVLFPDVKDSSLNELDLFVSASQTSITMVECSANQMQEDVIIDILDEALLEFKEFIYAVDEMKSQIGKKSIKVIENQDNAVANKIKSSKEVKDLEKSLYTLSKKLDRKAKIDEVKKLTQEKYKNDQLDKENISTIIDEQVRDILRNKVLKEGIRIDLRDEKTVRKITCEVGLLPRSHGSGLFTRGETQAISTVTLGAEEEGQITDDLNGYKKDNCFLHYNFHPYAAGEIASLRAPNRREINHGYLAFRAIQPVMPSAKEFPYTIRLNTEILESSGSTSKATVCGSILALMDAGVPIKKVVSGIAMGLVKGKNKFVILSDISVEEDNIGDMDFKVSGTRDGITAVQMDLKVDGVTSTLLSQAFAQAKEGRLHIIDKIEEIIKEPRKNVSKYAPIMSSINIDKADIKKVIGVGGQTIREICEATGSKVNLLDSGKVNICATNQLEMENTIAKIQAVLESEIKVGNKFIGNVVKIIESGAFVEFENSQGKDGFIHISEISNERVEDVTDYLSVDQKVDVVVVGVKDGRTRLSMKKYDFDINDIKNSAKKSFSSGFQDRKRDSRGSFADKDRKRDGRGSFADKDRKRGGGYQKEKGDNDRWQDNGKNKVDKIRSNSTSQRKYF